MGNLWIYKTYLYQQVGDWFVDDEGVVWIGLHDGSSLQGWVKRDECRLVSLNDVRTWFNNNTFNLYVMA